MIMKKKPKTVRYILGALVVVPIVGLSTLLMPFTVSNTDTKPKQKVEIDSTKFERKIINGDSVILIDTVILAKRKRIDSNNHYLFDDLDASIEETKKDGTATHITFLKNNNSVVTVIHQEIK